MYINNCTSVLGPHLLLLMNAEVILSEKTRERERKSVFTAAGLSNDCWHSLFILLSQGKIKNVRVSLDRKARFFSQINTDCGNTENRAFQLCFMEQRSTVQ